MRSRDRWRKATSVFAVLTVIGVFTSNPSGTETGADATPVIVGLNGPRGLAVGPAGLLVYAEIDGSFSVGVPRGHFAGASAVLGSVPATSIAPAVAASDRGQVLILTAGGPPESGAATLYRWRPGRRPQAVADIAAYQLTDPDPYNLPDGLPAEESNPFGIALLPDGSALVADAANNDLLRIYRNGTIVTVARFKPRVIAVPDELPDDGFPPAGTLLPSESVPTSVTVGADGHYYVGELRGFPATPGTSQIWRIAPDSVDAICDPEAPRRGACRRYADGFTSIVALDAGRDGSIYVVELVKQSWFQWELKLAEPIGSLFRIPPRRGRPIELAAGQLVLPGGVAVADKRTVYVTTPVFDDGMIVKVRVPVGDDIDR